MPTVVLKLFARQGTGQTDGWTDKAATICFPFGEHNKDMTTRLSMYMRQNVESNIQTNRMC